MKSDLICLNLRQLLSQFLSLNLKEIYASLLRMSKDLEFIKQAIALSETHMLKGEGGPFGAIIVKDGEVIGQGWNQVTSSNDPTAHAEVVAIRNACKNLSDFQLEGASIYTSCEPCPMCLAAIYWARIERIVYANNRNDAANIGFDDEFLYEEIKQSIENRKIPMEELARQEGLKVFKKWDEKEDKIAY